MSKVVEVHIDRQFHAAQKEIHDCPSRFRVVDAGRRFGKTRLGVWECLEVGLQGRRAWWVAPSYPIAQVGWRPLRRIGQQLPGTDVRLAEMSIMLPNGGEVRVRSADNPDSLRGEGLDLAVLDEAAWIKQEAWSEALRPALSDKLGRALFISTPRGRNWFWEQYQRGVRGDDDYRSFYFPTSANPHIPAVEIEAAKHELPEIIYRQEYLAEFIDDQGGVFRRVQEAAQSQSLKIPQEGSQYVAGVDVAASIDYTVVTVLDVSTHEMVYMDRFNRVDYNVSDRQARSNIQTMELIQHEDRSEQHRAAGDRPAKYTEYVHYPVPYYGSHQAGDHPELTGCIRECGYKDNQRPGIDRGVIEF